MLPVIFGLAGAVLGAASGTLGAAALGFAVGVLWKRLTEIAAQQAFLTTDNVELRKQQKSLERELLALQRAAEAPRPAAPPPAPHSTAPAPARPARPAPPQLPSLPVEPGVEPPSTPLMGSVPESPVTPPRPIPARPYARTGAAPVEGFEWIGPGFRRLVEFFTTGNVVAKVGMVIVFFGVAFLLRYAAEQGMLPIEYRLMSTAAGALVLLGFGWRLRHSRREYAVVLQGGAVGLLYLTIFAAFRLYGLLPASLTFALLLMVVGFSGVLAVVQGAMSLAVLGTSGGFLAPILASTGAGSHVTLFSYYGVLNAGVLGIAWFRAWRFLNWLAFVFTFGIGFIWGRQDYQPALFATTEPFLVIFFLLFLAVAVLFAHRQPPQLRGYIDGSLVFGTPAIAFGMQSVLVGDIPFGRAYSAVAVSALYLALARTLWRRDEALRPLTEAFLALAVVFLILAVPLAFDGHATAAAWALEGAGLVWIGTRQERRLARLVGAALLLGAGMAFAVMAAPSASRLAVLNTRFLGCAAIAAGSVMAARMLSRARAAPTSLEGALEWVLLAWGLLWWFGAVLLEIRGHVPERLFVSSTLLGIAASGCLVGFLARRWEWRAMMLATIPIGPMLWIWVVPSFVVRGGVGPLADLGWLAWPAVVASSYLLMFWFELVWLPLSVRIWHAVAAWLVVFLATWTLVVAVRQLVPDTPTWSSAIWCAVPAVFVLALRTAGASLAWPVRRFQSLYAGPIPFVPVAGMLLWVMWACGQRGAAAPLPYVPVLNPLELTQVLGLIVGYAWWTGCKPDRALEDAIGPVFRPLLAVLAFLALNMAVGRVVHFYLGVPFDIEDLVESSVFQAGISILWSLTAGVLMTLARMRLDRSVWMVGAGLLALLILKLFLVDLGNVAGIARIVSFLATGILILVIGYFAPAPPRTEDAT